MRKYEAKECFMKFTKRTVTAVVLAVPVMMCSNSIGMNALNVKVLAASSNMVAPAAVKSASYWNAVFAQDVTCYYDTEWESIDRDIKAQTKIHIIGSAIHPEYDTDCYKFEMEDGTIGYKAKKYITQNKTVVAQAQNVYMYTKSDVEVKSGKGSGKVVKIVLQGTKVQQLKTSGKYTQVKVSGKTGWVETSKLTKTMSKTLYATGTTTGHTAEDLSKSGRWLNVTVGTKLTLVDTYYRDGKAYSYQIKTPWGDKCWIKASKASTVVPASIYAKSNIDVYKKADTKSKKVAKVKQGTKITRISTKGKYYYVTYASGKKGYVLKSKVSFTKIGKKVKSYGTYYTCENGTLQTAKKRSKYDIGNLQQGAVSLGESYFTKHTKITRIDNYFYTSQMTKKDRSKKYNVYEGYAFIKVQLPDGTQGFIGMSQVGKSKKDVDKKTKITELKSEEQKALDYLNQVRKSKGLSTLKVNNTLKSKYLKIWNNYGKYYGLDHLAHTDTLPNLTGLGATSGKDSYAELVLNNNRTSSGKELTKDMIGNGTDSHGRQMLSEDYTECAIIILKQGDETYYAVHLQG